MREKLYVLMAVVCAAGLMLGIVSCGDDGGDDRPSANNAANNAANNDPNNAPNNAPNNTANNDPNNTANNAVNNTANNMPGDAGVMEDAASMDDVAQEDASVEPDVVDMPDGDSPVMGGEPLFEQVETYVTTVAGSGDEADVYHPAPADLDSGQYAFPLALMLQGANVDKSQYSGFATVVASYGFVVVVPNHMGFLGLSADTIQITEVLAHMRAAGGEPVAQALDTTRMVVLGHSAGGVAGIYGLQNNCQPPFCSEGYERPTELLGGAFYGTNLKPPFFGEIPDTVPNDGLAMGFVQGDVDGSAEAADTRTTYERVVDEPKAYIELTGANHYGVCDQNNPQGALPDFQMATLSQEVSVETAGRWAALFLRAAVLEDEAARAWFYGPGPQQDPNVTVTAVAP